jgi:signal transduction histidine kinase/DNA-binding response OmpR family regulator
VAELSHEKSDLLAQYEQLGEQALRFHRRSDYAAEARCLADMQRLATLLGQPRYRLRVVLRQVELEIQRGSALAGEQLAKGALAEAQATGDAALEADCLHALGRALASQGESVRAFACHEEALARYRLLGDRQGEAHSLRELGWNAVRLSGPAQGRMLLEEALTRYRVLGDREGEGMALNELALTTADYAQQRSYYEQALTIFEALGDRHRLCILANNLGLIYLLLGLYSQACGYCERAAALARELDVRSTLVFCLDTLAHAYLGLGDLEQARAHYTECRALAEQAGKGLEVAYAALGLGRVALLSGQAEQAVQQLDEAVARLTTLEAPGELATALSWLGAAQQARGDLAAADRATQEAARLVEAGMYSPDFPPQDIWWLRYQVLQARAVASAQTGLSEAAEQAQACLVQAYDTMQQGIAALSDAGLRRNYLNKVAINRRVIEEWAHQRVRTGSPASELPAPAPQSIQDQLARMLVISVQMNERREDSALREFLLDQLVELSGAERALLLLEDADVTPALLSRGVAPSEQAALQAEAAPTLDEVRQTRRAVLRQTQPEATPGMGEALQALRARSLLCLPLIAGGQLVGLLYADNRLAFGSFVQADLDLLTVLAAQAATALRNVRLYGETLRANRELEQRVAERTQSLERRVSELATVNRIGQAVASQLELDRLIELVGDTMIATFDVQNVYVALYDRKTELISFPYDVEHGQRIRSDALRFGAGLTSEILLTRQPLLLNGEDEMREAGLRITSIGAPARSFLGVPILVGEEAIGVISVQNTERDGVFQEADVRLLTTIASSVGIAIENARLYAETRHMQRAAEAASIAKSTFLANMSHELRTPLNSVLGFAQLLLRDEGLSLRQKEQLGIISRSGEHLLGLINDVLEMSKIEAGRVTLNTAPFDLPRLLRGVSEMFVLRAESKQLALRTEIDEQLPRLVVGDEGKLRQVLINLLGNAVKFTHVGGATLRVRRAEGNLLSFEVEDSGEGIAPEQLTSLFQPFVQTSSGLRSQEGTGLGLAISRQFVQLMGGEMSVRSEPGRGSLFHFEVMLPATSADSVAERSGERRVIGMVPEQRGRYRVLIADDKWENRRLLAEWLGAVGFQVREAANGQQALQVWEQWEPHLIWMDLRMPVMDGYEASRRIKSSLKGQGTVVIALTASTFEQEHAVTLATGCDDFVRKPVREATIFAKMARHLGVRFVYEEPRSGLEGSAEQTPRLTAELLAALPADLLAELRVAVEQVDAEAAQVLSLRARQHSPQAAAGLEALLAAFRFDVLQGLLEQH